MHTFTDASGQTWSVAITIDAIRRVRQLASVDLMQVVGGPLLDRIAGDPVLLVDVLGAVCKPQLDAKQVPPETFGQAMFGDAIVAGETALLLAIADFCPSQTRGLFLQVLEAVRANQKVAHDRAMHELEKLSL